MYLKSLELSGFKSFAKKTALDFTTPITSIVGPNGSGKSNVAESFRFVLGEQSIKSLRGKRGEDLIFNGSKTIGRQNRGSVKMVLDNAPINGKRLLNIDFDEVSIERVVHRDNANEYLINGSQVRLKDVVELLAQAHMGPTGHHIISQGEADRILNANLKERRLMIEDALGLKIYQYKRHESERKLERTRENISQVESLRRELAPHLRFLKKQVEKIEKAKELKRELITLYEAYLEREQFYLAHARDTFAQETYEPKEKLAALEKELAHARRALEKSEGQDEKSKQLLASEKEIREVRARRDTLVRDQGRLEGELSAEEKRLKKLREVAHTDEHKTVSLPEVRKLSDEIAQRVVEADRINDIGVIRNMLSEIRKVFQNFIKRFETTADSSALLEAEEEITRLLGQKKDIEIQVNACAEEEKSAQERYETLRAGIEKEKDESRDAEREIFKIMAAQNEVRGNLNLLKSREDSLKIEADEYERERREAAALVGPETLRRAEAADTSALQAEERTVQHERRRTLEKLKIRLEELGGSTGDDVVKEYQEATDRDAFLEREITDLETSAVSLDQLIKELTEKLDVEFKEGVHHINTQFEAFFKMMFGGGQASLSVVKPEKSRRSEEEILLSGEIPEEGTSEEEEVEEGIIISVNLPHKKVKSLEMLSGGERALTSIALLFAISQVNPPPFIVLDETDAALDEANSRKYGDMVQNLSQYSQLVLITHNRETMSRAGVLYGVTMGQDGVSKLLSIQFEEAVKVAK